MHATTRFLVESSTHPPSVTSKRQLLYLDGLNALGWIVTGDGKSGPSKLKEVAGKTARPSGRFPRESACGYEADQSLGAVLWGGACISDREIHHIQPDAQIVGSRVLRWRQDRDLGISM